MSPRNLRVPEDLHKWGSGSTKDIFRFSSEALKSARSPIEAEQDYLLFDFSDRISVFDYGPLPDEIPAKGINLESMARHFEELFLANQIDSAYDATLSEEFSSFVVRATGGATKIKNPQGNLRSPNLKFVPLECIFRFGVPEGSSAQIRYPKLKIGQIFSEPMVEFSTKLEKFDRYLATPAEIQEHSQLNTEELSALPKFVEKVALVLKNFLNEIGLVLWDGKIEVAWNSQKKKFCLVDAVTLDELRVTLRGLDRVPLSKELARQWLGATRWGQELLETKKRGLPVDKNLKEILSVAPPKLGNWRLQTLSGLYASFAETVKCKNSQPLWAWVRGEFSPAPRVFVSSGGGREEALKWRLQKEGAIVVSSSDEADAALVSLDAELEKGLVNEFQSDRKWIWAPTREASRIEWSKIFGRQIASEAGIPIPKISTKTSDADPAKSTFSSPPVVKFDGLAAGKGVVVPESWEEVEKAFSEFSKKGDVLFEERLKGPEASVFFAVTGEGVRFLGSAQDFKRRLAGDQGPNTGGMGAYVPSPHETPENIQVWKEWAESTVRVLRSKRIVYEGILYLGVIKDFKKGWMLIEYNARPGDPETQGLVVLWPQHERVLLSCLGLDLVRPRDLDFSELGHSVTLALVHPSYPSSDSKSLDLPSWTLKEESDQQVLLFKTSSKTGRLGYLVGRASTRFEAGDQIFRTLIESPWKTRVEWRADIL